MTNPKRQHASEGKKRKKAAKDKQEGVATRGTGSPKKVAKPAKKEAPAKPAPPAKKVTNWEDTGLFQKKKK